MCEIYFCIVLLACILSGTRKLNFTQKQDLLNNLLTYICLVNLFIVTIYDTRYGSDVMQYRYYIIMIIPLLILCGYRCEFYFKKMHKYQHGAFCCGFLAFLLVIIVGNNRTVLGSLHNNDYAVTICDYLDTLDVESVIFIDDQDTTALCRGIDHSKNMDASHRQNNSCRHRYVLIRHLIMEHFMEIKMSWQL